MCSVHTRVRNLFFGPVLVSPVPLVSPRAGQHCLGTRLGRWHGAVLWGGRAGLGAVQGLRWPCPEEMARGECRCHVHTERQRHKSCSWEVCSVNRVGIFSLPHSQPLPPPAAWGPLGCSQGRGSPTLFQPFSCLVLPFRGSAPQFWCSAPQSQCSALQVLEGLGSFPVHLKSKGRAGVLWVLSGMDGSGSLTGRRVISRMVFLMRQVSSRQRGG